MNFRNILSTVKGLFTVKGETRKYLVYVTIIVAILGVVGMVISRSTNAKLQANLVKLETERDESNGLVSEALAQILNAKNVIEIANFTISGLHEEIDATREKFENLSLARETEQQAIESLEAQLVEAHTELSGNKLKNSFVAEQIVTGLRKQFPSTEHIFFSETQVNLFRTNPATANLIHAVIMENAVRIQLVKSFGVQVTILTKQVEHAEMIVSFRGEQILAMTIVNDEYRRTQENLEAALTHDRRYVKTLERQIALMNRKNLFQRIMPTLNVIIGPYYDPFKNTAGFGVAFGLGWRF